MHQTPSWHEWEQKYMTDFSNIPNANIHNKIFTSNTPECTWMLAQYLCQKPITAIGFLEKKIFKKKKKGERLYVKSINQEYNT